MRKLEVIILVICSLALLLLFFNVPGGVLFSFASISLLSFLYLFTGWVLVKTDKLNIYVRIIYGLILSLSLQGILFQLMNWKGSYNISVLSIIYLLIFYAAIGLIKKQFFLRNLRTAFFLRGVITFLLNLFLLML